MSRIAPPPFHADPAVERWMRDMTVQLNGVSETKIAQRYNFGTAAPTEGKHNKGDFVPNKNPAELGSSGSKYVLLGWICVDSSPLTFKEARALTGG